MGAISGRTRRHRRNRLAAEMAVTYHPRKHFRLGQDIGWHWQIDDPNTLYRRRNRLTYTRDFSNAAWVKTNILSTTSDADGVGDLVVPNTTNATHILVQAVGSIGVPSVLTIRAKAGGYNHIAVTAGTPTGYANVNTGTAGTVSGGMAVSVSASADATGYFDAVFTYTPTSVNTTIYIANADGSPTYAGDGTSGVYFARAQLETYTTTPTEYQDVPTTWAQAYLDAVGAERIYAWTNTAGTIPVTAIGDGIGLLLGREYGGARGVNSWNPGAVSFAGGSSQVSSGVYRIYSSAGVLSYVAGGTTVVGRLYEVQFTIDSITTLGGGVTVGDTAATFTTTGRKTSVWLANLSFAFIKRDAGATDIQISNVSIREIPGTHLTQATVTAKPTLSARVNLLLNTATMSTQNVTTVATSYKLSFTGTGTVTLSGTSTAGPLVGTGANDRVSLTFTPTAGTLTLTVSGSVTLADLRTADDAAKNIPAYQRVGATAADHDTDGFPHYALHDGTDDAWASVATVDGSSTDKVSFVAAVTKSSDAADGVILAFGDPSGGDAGSFIMQAPGSAAVTKLQLSSRGTTQAVPFTASTTYNAPITMVAGAVADIGSPLAQLSINGVTVSTITTTQGGGNYNSAKSVSVGQRIGGTARFNGRFYGSTGRFGPMGDSERNNLTRWWMKRIGTA